MKNVDDDLKKGEGLAELLYEQAYAELDAMDNEERNAITQKQAKEISLRVACATRILETWLKMSVPKEVWTYLEKTRPTMLREFEKYYGTVPGLVKGTKS
jgi:hypothetical protein